VLPRARPYRFPRQGHVRVTVRLRVDCALQKERVANAVWSNERARNEHLPTSVAAIMRLARSVEGERRSMYTHLLLQPMPSCITVSLADRRLDWREFANVLRSTWAEDNRCMVTMLTIQVPWIERHEMPAAFDAIIGAGGARTVYIQYLVIQIQEASGESGELEREVERFSQEIAQKVLALALCGYQVVVKYEKVEPSEEHGDGHTSLAQRSMRDIERAIDGRRGSCVYRQVGGTMYTTIPLKDRVAFRWSNFARWGDEISRWESQGADWPQSSVAMYIQSSRELTYEEECDEMSGMACCMEDDE